jgi:glutamate-1-semialdehyde 2,1-aminomutase
VYATRDSQRQPSQPYRTLFLQEMLKHGFLVPSLVLSYAHSDEDISRTIEAAAESLRIYREALEVGTEKYLLGRPIKPVFRKYC